MKRLKRKLKDSRGMALGELLCAVLMLCVEVQNLAPPIL